MESEERPTKLRKLGHSPASSPGRSVHGLDASAPQQQSVLEQGEAVPNAAVSEPLESLNDTEATKAVPLSKNQQKKLKKQQQWEAGSEARKVKRKERTKAAKERKRDQFQKAIIAGDYVSRKSKGQGLQLPITFIIDCNFDDMMFEPELKSLATQITRCYSDNKNAPFKAHLAVSSFGGKLKERFDGVLEKHHESWKGIRFLPEDFVAVSEKAKEWMKDKDGGKLGGHLQREEDTDAAEPDPDAGEVVYLSSESDVTLEHLNPYSTYIIGGLVDKNRHKGICHRRAMDRNIKTAKLPIGDFLQMNSRAVLATNHVVEIMLRWLELGDWGKAFMEVIPRRKGITLKELGASQAEQSEDDNTPRGQEELTVDQAPATDGANGNADKHESGDWNLVQDEML